MRLGFFIMKKLILIRHGETGFSLKGRYCGTQDVPLTKKGMYQAASLHKRFKKIHVDGVYSSDLTRCADTAKIVFDGQAIRLRKGLREIDFGDVSGLRYRDLKKKFPEIYDIWLKAPLRLKMPRGESLVDFKRRVEGAFSRIIKKNPGKVIAIVSHGGAIRVMLLKLQKMGLEKMWEIEQLPAAVNIVDFIDGRPRMTAVNDTSHMKG